ncbi:rhodanese-related sulfurtransferase [Clostridium pascui]|uniref:rhodanese-like domain-containing protein n=1 Tax=Clostridium pascui TaxID=46609 RepID=UPI00195DC5CD|nr:rhodanese-like domain-containing protein [Clostridium pascui]MBM7869116.1 rhodanese-related sulfurtransferase [Clostridium pascui]
MIKSFKSVKIICLIAAILLIGLFSGCSSKNAEINKEGSISSEKASFNNITPEEANERLERDKGIILLDVRTKEEYKNGHIKGSMLIPVDNLKTEAEIKLKDKDSPIFVYCRSGNRSVTAANLLVNLGYTNVYNLGGINNWPYEVVK